MYVPGCIFVILSIIAYIKGMRQLKKLKITQIKKNLFKKIAFYPLFMLIDLLPIIITRILEFFDEVCISRELAFLSAIVYSLHGIMIAITFNFANQSQKIIKENEIIYAKDSFSSFSSINLLLN